jgi:hypothetical protein
LKKIPNFKKYSILGSKNKEFIDFCSVLFLEKYKSHLTEEGLNQILEAKAARAINSGMNFCPDTLSAAARGFCF